MEPVSFIKSVSAIFQFLVKPLWKPLRKPKYIPIKQENWSPKIKRMMGRAGYYQKHTTWVPLAQVSYQEGEGSQETKPNIFAKASGQRGSQVKNL